MPWRKNRKLVEAGFRDLEYVPRDRHGWDATLGCLAFGARMDIERGRPDLGAWAARHGVAASGRSAELGGDALVLWHGTSRQRAEKIAEHGLFHKKGLWTALHPTIPHSFCRGRAERFGTEGAVVCIALDRRELAEGHDYEVEGNGDVYRFRHRLPPDVVEYVLVHDGIAFAGRRRSKGHPAWPRAKFARREGKWAAAQKAPVRYSDAASYSTPAEFAGIVAARMLAELGEVAAIEVFSAIYSCTQPWDAISHDEIIGLIDGLCVRGRRRGKWQTYRAATP